MSILNPAGVFGEAASVPQGAIARTMVASTTVSAGQIVALSTSTGQVIQCLTNTAQKLVVGVALANIASGSAGLICIYGPCYGVKKDTASAVTAGDVVTRAATDTAGVAPLAGTTAITQFKDAGLGIGVAMASAAATATTVDIFVCKQ